MCFKFILKSACVALCLQAFQGFVCDSFASSDDEVIVMIPSNHSSNRRPHTKAKIPFEVSYCSETSSVSVLFLHDIGQVEVSIMNVSSGSSHNYVINGNAGFAFLPISGDSGYYIITFHLENGRQYAGEFQIC